MNTLKISVPELIAAVPAALDAVPVECVVALGITAGQLPAFALTIPRERLLDPTSAAATAAAVAEDLAAGRIHTALLISYTAEDIRDGCPALEELRLEVEMAVPVVELVGIVGDEFFRPGCHEEGCCPRPMVDVPSSLLPLFAQSHARRRALSEARGEAAALWSQAFADGAVVDATTARRMAASLDDLCVRDWVVLTILGASSGAAKDALEGVDSYVVADALDCAMQGGARPRPRDVERVRAVVERVSRAARGRHRQAAVHTLAAILEWWVGDLDGAFERSERALDKDARYRLAELVHMACTRGIGPGWLRRAGQTVQ